MHQNVVFVADVPNMIFDITQAIFMAYRTCRDVKDIFPLPLNDLLPTKATYGQQNNDVLMVMRKLSKTRK